MITKYFVRILLVLAIANFILWLLLARNRSNALADAYWKGFNAARYIVDGGAQWCFADGEWWPPRKDGLCYMADKHDFLTDKGFPK